MQSDIPIKRELLNEWVSDFLEKAKKKAKEKGRAENKEEGWMEGYAVGWAEGYAESKMEIAIRLLHKGHPPDYVAEIIDYPIDKVKKLTDDTKRLLH